MTDHRWRLFVSSGVTQVILDSAEDLRALPSLDLKLWVALAWPYLFALLLTVTAGGATWYVVTQNSLMP